MIIGLGGADQSCPVCNVKPQIFRAMATEGVVECGRCGLPSTIDVTALPGDQVPQLTTSPAWIGIFRRYWSETGLKITAPELVGPDIELAGRMKALNQWCSEHAELVAAASLAAVAPYSSVTAICVQVQSPSGDEIRQAWSMLLPNQTAGVVLKLPFSAEGFTPGTVITIQTPIQLPGQAPDEPSKVGP
jgi:hypothetical protein